MKISLITAAFNSARTICDTLDSVARQNAGCEIEHIIMDGASTDGTAENVVKLLNDGCWKEVPQWSEFGGQRPVNLKTYQLNNRTTTILSEKDSGMYDAMNKGIRMATGDVIGLLNSDDMLAAPDVLEKIAQVFSDPSVEAVYGDLVFVDGSDADKIRRVWRPGAFIRRKLSFGWIPPHPTLYLRRSVYEKHGVFDLSFGSAADVEFMMRIFSRGICARYIPRIVVRMRLGGVSTRPSNILLQNRSIMRGMRKNGVVVSSLFWPVKISSRLVQYLRGVAAR